MNKHVKQQTGSKVAFIAGAGGFIAGHLATQLKSEGYNVQGCDIKPLDEWWFGQTTYDIAVPNFDARMLSNLDYFDEVYCLACDMGGMGFIANHPLECMHSVTINQHLLRLAHCDGVDKYFYSSSACVYPDKPGPLSEGMAYPAMPDSAYGWEKLFSEIYCQEFYKKYGQEIDIYIARFHNVYGPRGTWTGGREKAPAAMCRKAAELKLGINQDIEIWGSGNQLRSFLYIDDCIRGIRDMMQSDLQGKPTNIGSERPVSITHLADLAGKCAGFRNPLLRCVNVTREEIGVSERCSMNSWFKERISLEEGMQKTYDWVEQQVMLNVGRDSVHTTDV